ncbi:glycosyltransferase involved in cell wall biosynthesis [Chitinophaga niastensis]|uniref:Glycosyltransferase involved in cell wall biosynthesis n=1 Tax=Chitinophaga niastensis TaxID=536980 RepID=A0A2P8HS42_CHINA|nr:glycosyltransferase [Chitinophaga niastensis]PSL49059.1 glycosyltransferase involved in cell wall biosynthesis [Chitinophaga niastensis]
MNRTLLFVTSYPPRECGIATFAQDLVNAMHKSFAGKLNIEICALEESGKPMTSKQAPVLYSVNPFDIDDCIAFAQRINENNKIDLVCFEHEFGLYGGEYGHNLLAMLSLLDKPFVVRFHTVLPYPDNACTKVVSLISALAAKVIVMTESSAQLLRNVYLVPAEKIVHIPHGTHAHIVEDVTVLKKQYNLDGKLVLTTFGLLSENKGMEVGIKAMKDIVKEYPDAIYLILGKTHPVIFSREGERYRDSLEQLVKELDLENNVRFVNSYLSLKTLLDYLSLTDIYLFTSKDPYQAVSGTFVYAMSAGCAVISTAFAQALEMLEGGVGCLIDFNNPDQLATAALRLLGDPALRQHMSQSAIEKTRSSIWENVAIAHMAVINEALVEDKILPNLPPPYLDHIDRMTNEFGMLQFSKHDVPDPDFGYTLDDNARALIAGCMYSSELKPSSFVNSLCRKYIDFIGYCQKASGKFLNYVNIDGGFSEMNEEVNLEDANGRAVWALGYTLYSHRSLPFDAVQDALSLFRPCLRWMESLSSPRAIAFTIKGLYYFLHYRQGGEAEEILRKLAAKLHNAYMEEADDNWHWYEPYLTYGNAVLPEAMMMAYQVTGIEAYRKIAEDSLAFLCSKTFTDSHMKVISNKTWYHKNAQEHKEDGGEQSIEVAYTMLAMNTFYNTTKNHLYLEKMRLAFSWYLGNNHLKQLIYNPLTYGCYDGLEKNNVNQNQGAESTVCYLIARLLMEQWNKHKYVTKKQDSLEPARLGFN